MIIRAHFILFFIASSTFFCHGQNEHMVVAKSRIFMRDSSTLQSKRVCSIKFGEMVQSLNVYSAKDTVDGMAGYWIKVKYKANMGFVFDAYLGSFAKQDKSFPKNYPQYFSPSLPCGEDRYFNSDLHWYGVSYKDEKFDVKKVKAEFSVKKENWHSVLQEYYMDRYLKVDVEAKESLLFLIGLPDSIPNYSFPENEFMSIQRLLRLNSNGFIYPGQTYEIGYAPESKATYYVEAYGTAMEVQQGVTYPRFSHSSIKDYKISVIEEKNGKVRTQDLLKVEELPIFKPSIQFVGDLNHDSIPDLLIRQPSSMYEAETNLWMSGYSSNELLTKVAVIKWGSCY